MSKQKVYLLGSIRWSKYLTYARFDVLARYLFQLIVLLISDSNCLESFMFSRVDEVTTET